MSKQINATISQSGTAKVESPLKVKMEERGNDIGAPRKADTNVDPVFSQYGDPFLIDEKGKVRLNERAIAVKCATDHLVKYDPAGKTYERFDAQRGLWSISHEVEVRRRLGDLLLKLGGEFNRQEFVKLTKASQLN